jgi:LysR family transcriptional regulator, glycine cleavage system transcriptional activator
VKDTASELRLPPLNALRAFEAAGRLQSIRRAAAELMVTPGAVSRHVRLLENWLGVALFRRTTHSVVLTAVGEQYLAAVGPHLQGIAAATDIVAVGDRDAQLKVRTWTLFAGWLIPRLPDFRRCHPGIEVHLMASSQRADFRQADVDVEIIGYDSWDGMAPERDAGLLGDPSYDAVRAVRSDLVCVCSPEYVDGKSLAQPRDLLRLGDWALLHSLTSPELWDRWLSAAGVCGMDSRHGQVFGDSALTAAAARAGQGIALLPRMIVQDDIREGRLTVPISGELVSASFDFYLLARPDRLARPHVRVFCDWLQAQSPLPMALQRAS